MGDGDTRGADPVCDDEPVVVAGDPTAGTDRDDRPPPDGSTPARPGVAGETVPVGRSFDWRGWLLVGAIAVCFLVIPGVILAYPYVGRQLGVPFYHTYLALPMIPAVVLAVLAVWATTRP
jgi:hypothetical protein